MAAEGKRLRREVWGWQGLGSLVQAPKLAVFSQPPPMTTRREIAQLRLKSPGAHHQLGCTEHPEPPGGTQLQGAPFTLQSVELGSGGMQLVENNMSNAPGGVQLRHENSSG